MEPGLWVIERNLGPIEPNAADEITVCGSTDEISAS